MAASEKPTKRNMKPEDEHRAAEALEAQLRALIGEDDFTHGLTALDAYPKLKTRELSSFELDMRDWGYAYGLAFGLALSANPEMAHEDAAKLALAPARRVYTWWGGEIEDPGERRERAIRAMVQQVEECSRQNGPFEMTNGLAAAIHNLVESARG